MAARAAVEIEDLDLKSPYLYVR